MNSKVFVINPGSTSTKIAMYHEGSARWEESISHSFNELSEFPDVPSQLDMRYRRVVDAAAARGESLDDLAAVAARGGAFAWVKSGTYEVNEKMLKASNNPIDQHASNLGCSIAWKIAKPRGIKAYICDAVTVDELIPIVRITGIKNLLRHGQGHNLNMRAAAIKYCEQNGKDYYNSTLLVAHLGGGITQSLHHQGRIIDMVSDHEGSFSPERAGLLPGFDIIRLCYSGQYTLKEMLALVQRKGGLVSHFGTADTRVVEAMAAQGDEQAELVFEAMALNVARCLARLAVAVNGSIDCIILTGGIAYSQKFTSSVKEKVRFLAPVEIIPGENEMQALYDGTMRVLRGDETAHVFGS